VMSEQTPTWREGLWPALICAVLLIGTFLVASASITMPPAERWASITVFGLLTVATTLQGSIGIYDALGRTVRRDMRALLSLLALVPMLYLAYSTIVGEFTLNGLIIALLFVTLPAVALLQARGVRTPTPFDAVAALYLILSLDLSLVPSLSLPQQGGLVRFFVAVTTPMLLVLLAARGWPGLGFSWFLSPRDLRVTLLAALVVVLSVLALAFGLGISSPSTALPSAGTLFAQAVFAYFFTALPTELLYRGMLQNGLERLLRTSRLPTERAGQLALLLTALFSGLVHLNDAAPGWPNAILGVVIALGAGYTYQRTGKVTASAVVYALAVWAVGVFG
jgi:membrane protease YdiL (CAAX protease family)